MRDADELTKLADEWKKRADDMGSNDPVSRAHIMVLRNCSRELRQLPERADHVPDTGNKVEHQARPADASIAQAFWRVSEYIDLSGADRRLLQIVVAEAMKDDAERAAGTARPSEEVMRIVPGSDESTPVARGEDSKASPPYPSMLGRVCCRYCGSETHHMGNICFPCGKSRKNACSHPGCGTPTQPSACDFAQCPRK